jgi:hypothetical protein
MVSNALESRAVLATLITDKPVKKTAYQVKGVFMRHYPDLDIIPMLNGKYRDRYLYPRVQVKVLNEQIYIIGVGDGSDCVLQLIDNITTLDFGNITFEVNDKNIIYMTDQFQQSDQLIRYRFVTPWVALNQTTGRKYRALNNSERVSFLNKLLGQNIVFIAKELDVDIKNKVFTKVNLSSLFPKPVDENNWGAFSGEFSTNFNLPNYIGLGNGITRGYGAIYGLFNPQEFHFEENTSTANPSNKDAESDKMSVESELNGINVDDVPKSRRKILKKRKKKNRHFSKKLLSEEFDIEENVPDAIRRRKLSRKGDNTKFQDRKENEEPNFNTALYHKKQHKI